MFQDPLGTVNVSLPPSWAFDALSSSLTDLVFLDWTAPNERQFFVHVQPSETDAGATDDEWEAQICASLPAEATRVERREGPWIVVERPGREGRPAQRWGIVRGPRLDTILEQVGVPLGGALSTPELTEAVRTLAVTVNRRLGTFRKESEFKAAMAAAQQAADGGDLPKAAALLAKARAIAKDVWLYSLVSSPFPEVPAAIAEAEAALAQAQATGSALFLQQATLTLYRCRATLPKIPAPSAPAQMKRVDMDLAQAMEIQGKASGEGMPNGPFWACIQRSRLLLHELQGILKSGKPEHGGLWASMAVEDAMTAVAYAGRLPVQVVSPEAAAMFAAKGIVDPATQLKALNDLLLITALDHLVAACVASFVSRAQANLEPQRTTSANGLLAARRLVEISETPEHERGLVIALSHLAGAYLWLGDEPSIEQAERLIEEAQARLDKLGDEGELRAQICLNQGWLRHTKRHLDGSLGIVERAITAANKVGAERLERAARSLRSQFLAIEGRIEESVMEARRALEATHDDAASTHHLNLAVALNRAGQGAAALKEIQAGLAAALADKPLGPEVLRLLYSAAALLDSSDSRRSLVATEVAELVLDVQRLRVGDSVDRIAFDDAYRHRQVAASLVQRRLDADDILGALATADRHRARSLAQAIRLVVPKGEVTPDDAWPPPPASDAPLDQQFAYIATVARRALGHEGLPEPLDGKALVDAVVDAGRTAVVFHPNEESLLLFVIRPGEKVIVATARSSLSVTDILSLTNALRFQLGIMISTRAARGELPPQSIEEIAAGLADDDELEAQDAELDRLRRQLHDALLSEVLPLLRPNEPVVVVPYRELSVIPLSILMGADGHSLAKNHPLSLLPSLASLGALARPHAGTLSAVVVGDPAVHPRFGLSRLPGAATEAKHVADILRDSGLETTPLLHEAATESAFRDKVRGARVVHLACHATVQQQASASSLFLAPGPHDDGLLLPGEIADLSLNGALVVLAACQSGLGRTTADGVLGIGRAFVQAGARAVVLSLWRVSDPATAHLMTAFYDALCGKSSGTKERLDVASALRYAQLATRDAVTAHASAWGPWLVIGDGGWKLP